MKQTINLVWAAAMLLGARKVASSFAKSPPTENRKQKLRRCHIMLILVRSKEYQRLQ